MKKTRIHNRITVFVLALVLAFSAAACGPQSEESRGDDVRSYQAFFLNQEQDQIQAELFSPMDDSTETMLLELVALQQQGPKDKELVPLLPEGTKIRDYELSSGTLTIDLDASYTAMEPSREILTRAGLVRTFVQVDGVSRVVFQVEGEPLTDPAGNEVGALTAASFLENAGKEINAYQQTSLVLYFTDEAGEGLVSERRTAYYTSNEPLERVVIEELMRGPSETGHYPVIASTVSVLSVTTQDQVCYVNFESSTASPLITASEEVQLYAIVNSLIENCSVSKVQFSIADSSEGVFLQEISLDQNFEKNTQLIKSE